MDLYVELLGEPIDRMEIIYVIYWYKSVELKECLRGMASVSLPAPGVDDEFVPRPPPLRDGVPLTLSYSTFAGKNGRAVLLVGEKARMI